jgi:hypothetical protein
MDNVISHPAFERDPIINQRLRGRPPGTVSLATHRRHRNRDTKLQSNEFHAMRTGNAIYGERRPETDAERADRLEITISEIATQFVHMLQEAREPNKMVLLMVHISRVVELITESREVHHG